MDLAPALNAVRIGGFRGLPGGRRLRGEHRKRRGDERMQAPGRDQPCPQQLQVGQGPCRGLGQHRQRGDLPRWQRVAQWPQRRGMSGVGGDECERGPVTARAEPHGEGPARQPLRAQQQLRLGRPTARRPAGLGGSHPARPAPQPELSAAARVPEVSVQVEPEAPVGVRVWMRGRVPTPGGGGQSPVPQGEGHPLPGVRPGRRCPYDQVQRCDGVPLVADEGEGEARPEPSVGGDAGHVPPQQIGRQPTQIRAEAGEEFGAVAVADGAQIEVDVDACGGAGSRPVTGGTPCGRGLDHGRWHGVLTDALPHRQVGRNLVREVMCHQHSPCANDSPIPCEEKFFIAGILTTDASICQCLISPARPPGAGRGGAGRVRPARRSLPGRPRPHPRGAHRGRGHRCRRRPGRGVRDVGAGSREHGGVPSGHGPRPASDGAGRPGRAGPGPPCPGGPSAPQETADGTVRLVSTSWLVPADRPDRP